MDQKDDPNNTISPVAEVELDNEPANKLAEAADPVQGRISGLLPVAVFLVLFIGSGVILNDFYAMPAVVAFLVALTVAFLQKPKRSFNEKLESVVSSMGQSNVMIMCLVFVLAGAFTGAVSAAGGVESTVNFALSVLPSGIVLPGLFLIVGLGSNYNIEGSLDYNLWQVLPYVAVLVTALIGVNVFAVFVGGTVLSIIVGVALGTIEPAAIATVIGCGPTGGGIMNMYDITVISLICAGIIGLVKDNGGIHFILNLIHSRVKSCKGAEGGIAILTPQLNLETQHRCV